MMTWNNRAYQIALLFIKVKMFPKHGSVYICDKVNDSLPLDSPLRVHNIDIAQPFP